MSSVFSCAICQQSMQWSDDAVCELCQATMQRLWCQAPYCPVCGRVQLTTAIQSCLFCQEVVRPWDNLYFLWRSSSLAHRMVSRLEHRNAEAWARLIAQQSLSYWQTIIGMDQPPELIGKNVLFSPYLGSTHSQVACAAELWSQLEKAFAAQQIPTATGYGMENRKRCAAAGRMTVFQYRLLDSDRLIHMVKTLKKWFHTTPVDLLVIFVPT